MQIAENQHKFKLAHKHMFSNTLELSKYLPPTSLLCGFYVPSLKLLYFSENQRFLGIMHVESHNTPKYQHNTTFFSFWQKILRPMKILLLNEKNCVSFHRETDAK